jgi:hypothetical protein
MRRGAGDPRRSNIFNRMGVATRLGLAPAVVALSGIALSSPSKGDELLKDEQHRLAESKTNDSGTKAGSALNMHTQTRRGPRRLR